MPFFIGQPVRVVVAYTPAGLRHVGKQARIAKRFDFPEATMYALDIQAEVVGRDGGFVAWVEHQLEPVRPSGDQPAEFTMERLMSDLRKEKIA